MTTLYKSFIKSKTGDVVPVFYNGKPCASRYDPKKEAATFFSSIPAANFYLILGVAGAFHILEAQNKTSAKIVAVDTKDGLDFLKNNVPQLSLIDKNRTTLCAIEDVDKTLPKIYLPALYKKFALVDLKCWSAAMGDSLAKIREKILLVIDSIKSDYVTQSKFGKQWQHNILINIRNTQVDCFVCGASKQTRNDALRASPTGSSIRNDALRLNTTGGSCIVVAAGPTLDSKLPFIKAAQSSTFIIACDTAYRSLFKAKVKVDAALTIDPQRASIFHYIDAINKNTTYIMDMAASHTLSLYIKKAEGTLRFITTGHPLVSALFKDKSKNVPLIDGGAGTVTIAALDVAKKMGFSKITLIGADFSYIGGATYCKNTYLSDIFQSTSNRLNTAETQEVRGLYRHKTKNLDNENNFVDNRSRALPKRITNALLTRYKNGLYNWALANGYTIDKKNDEYTLTRTSKNSNKSCPPVHFYTTNYNEKNDYVTYKAPAVSSISNVAFLPFVAYLEGKDSFEHNFDYYIECAKKDFTQYTK